MSSKLKKLAAIHERYNISLEHRFTATGPQIKATIVIPGENNTFLKRVSTNFTTGTTLQDAEKNAVDSAVEMLLGNKLTKRLTEKHSVFDLQLVPFDGPKDSPIGVKAMIHAQTDDGKPFRSSVSLATGTNVAEVEAEVIKSVINSVLGV